MSDDPLHPILEKPWLYELVGFNYQAVEDGPLLELTLRKGAILRRLRFLGPQQVNLERDFNARPGPSGIAIFDVSASGLEGLGVQVSDHIPDHGCQLTFWARDVVLADGEGEGDSEGGAEPVGR